MSTPNHDDDDQIQPAEILLPPHLIGRRDSPFATLADLKRAAVEEWIACIEAYQEAHHAQER